MVEITGVTANSPAQRAGLAAGDFLCSVGGHEIVDVLDYQFYMTQKNPELVYRRGEKEHRLRLRKGDDPLRQADQTVRAYAKLLEKKAAAEHPAP